MRLATIFFAAACVMPLVAQPLAGSRPNIILVLTDDQGMGDLSCMGNPILRTPHLDRFYAQSTRLANFHVSPTCSPTRGALMSGRYPFEVGITHTIAPRERLSLDVVTVPQALQKAGYKTGIFGKWHLGDEESYAPGQRGFDEVLVHGGGGIGQFAYGDFQPNRENTYFDSVLLHNDTVVKTKGFCTDLFFEAALGWIREQVSGVGFQVSGEEEEGSGREAPFFAYISLNAPHGPMIAPERYKQRFLDEGYDEQSAGRFGMIENLDDNFGKMMDQLAAWKVLGNTLVIFMTDNGTSRPWLLKHGKKLPAFSAGLRGAKNTPYDGGTRVPSFWHWKGVLREGVDVDRLTAHLDLYKTFCELAGAAIPESKLPPRGRSLLPLLANSEAPWDDRKVFVNCGRWKPGEREAAKYYKNSVRTETWRWAEDGHLYDLANDPGEKRNVAAQHPNVEQELRAAYDQWWESMLPYMVNDDLPRTPPGHYTLQRGYTKQLKERGIPEWSPAALTGTTKRQAPGPRRPNVILCMTDDQGWGDVGYSGHPVLRTPHLDQMAKDGIRFDRFYATSPVCSPTRAACLTGRHPYRQGIPFANTGCLKREEITLPEVLKEQGYRTGHFGKWHLGSLTTKIKDGHRGRPGNTAVYSPPWENGYDECFVAESGVHTYHHEGVYETFGTRYWTAPDQAVAPEEIKGDDSKLIMDRAIPFMERAVEADTPFLAVIWFHAPHAPVVSAPPYTDGYDEHEEYYGCLTAMDEQMGRLRAKLRDLGVEEDTMLWFCSDNGPTRKGKANGSTGGLLGGKRYVHEGGVRVPGLLVWPRMVDQPRVVSTVCSTSDYFPTILDTLGVPLPNRPYDGISLLPMLRGDMTERPTPLYFEHCARQKYAFVEDNPENQTAVIENRYKIVSIDGEKTYTLFDLTRDRGEREDIAAQHPEIVQRMRQDLEGWRRACRDSAAGKDYGQ